MSFLDPSAEPWERAAKDAYERWLRENGHTDTTARRKAFKAGYKAAVFPRFGDGFACQCGRKTNCFINGLCKDCYEASGGFLR